MKYIKTPDNNQYLSGLLFLLIMFIAASLFIITVNYRVSDCSNEPSGLGDGSGNGVFGAGTGNGTGTGKGDGSEDGQSNGSGNGTAEDGKSENNSNNPGDGRDKEKSEEKKNDEPVPVKEDKKIVNNTKKGSDAKKVNGSNRKNSAQRIFIGNNGNNDKDDKNNKNEPEVKNEFPASNPGKSSFSSGGRSVFKVKKHENVIFVIDISPSMDAHTRERLPRIEVLKMQLKSILRLQRKQGSNGKYGILAFSTGTIYFPSNGGQMRFKSSKDYSISEKWINNINNLPRSGTPIYQAMEKTMQLLKDKDLEFDSVYLLTDGEPTDVIQKQPYVDMIKKELPKHVKIHTISIGHESDLLREIAKRGRGNYDKYE